MNKQAELNLHVNQVPSKPLRINVLQRGFSFTPYTSFTFKMVSPQGVLLKNVSGSPDTYDDGNALVLPWTFLGINTSTFNVPGDYAVQITLNGPGVEDVTTPAVIQIFERIA